MVVAARVGVCAESGTRFCDCGGSDRLALRVCHPPLDRTQSVLR